MNRNEFLEITTEMSEIWPRLNMSDKMLSIWFDKVGQHFHAADVKQVLSDFVECDDRLPSIAVILPKLKARFPSVAPKKESPFYLPPAYPALEWLMDTLGVLRINKEIRSIVGKDTKLSELVASRGWVQLYKNRMDELFLEAKEVSGISDQEFNALMYQHHYGPPPGVKWKDKNVKAQMFSRWSEAGPVE